MSKKEKILDSWIMVEHLSEGSIKVDKDYFKLDNIEDNDYYSYLCQIIKEKNVGKKGGAAFYFDIFDFDEVVTMLRKKYNLQSTETEIDKSQKFSFVLCFDKEMNFLQDMTFFTESAYIRYYNEIPEESKFKVFEDKFKEDLVQDFDESSDDPEKFNKAIIKLMNKYKISKESCRVQVLKNTETGTENLHSFFIEDLEKAKSISTKNLDAYLFGNADDRVNLDSKKDSPNFNPAAFEKILEPKNYPLGRFPSNTKFSLSLMQQVAVNLSTGFDNNQMRSVNGPPGTGKTTLLKDIFAQLVVEQAYDICNLSDRCIKGTEETVYFKNASIGVLPENIAENNIVVASSNNGAVQNIVNELPLTEGQIDDKFVDKLKSVDYFREISNSKITAEWKNDGGKNKKEVKIEPGKEEKFWGLFSLEGGKSDNMNNIINNLECVEKYLNQEYMPDDSVYDDFLKSYKELENYREEIQKKSLLMQNYLNNNKELQDIDANYSNNFNQKKNNAQNQIDEINNSLIEINKQISELENSQKEIDLQKENLNQQKTDAQVYFNSIKEQKPGIFAKKQEKESYKNKVTDASERMKKVLDELSELNNRENNIKIQINQLKTKSDEYLSSKNKINDDFKNWNASVKEKFQRLKSENDKTEKYLQDIKPLDMDIDYDELHLSNPWFNEDYRIAQSELFIKALSVRKQFLYENRKNIKASTIIWNSQKKYAEKKQVIVAAWNWINFAIPVISSTFASFSRMCKNLGVNTLGHLFIDEAGQALPQASVGAIFRSKNVCVVGDPSQIKPVLTLDENILNMLGTHFGVNEKYLSDSASTQTLVDAASHYGFYREKDMNDDSWIGIPLWVHRRCNYPMFTISNEISYNGYMVQGKKEDGKADWYDVKGKANNKYVKEQGEFLMKILQEMISENPAINDKKQKDIVYVISPFKNVAYQLAQKLKQIGFTRYDEKGKCTNIGTIHTFQGKEAPIVFMVLGADTQSSGAARWAVGEPNMMNVAATRAKKEFYVIGDSKMYLGLGSNVATKTYRIIEKFKKEHPETVKNIPTKQEKTEQTESQVTRLTGIVTRVGQGKKTKYAYVTGDDGKKYTINEYIFAHTENADEIIVKNNEITFIPENKNGRFYATKIEKI